MESREIYVRSLLVQYRVHRLELLVFTVIFIMAMLIIPAAWIINHVYHDFRLGWMLAIIAALLGLSMATHCGNTLRVLRRITRDLNQQMGERQSFAYDQGQETEEVRFWVTLLAKAIGGLILLWCFTPWPQL